MLLDVSLSELQANQVYDFQQQDSKYAQEMTYHKNLVEILNYMPNLQK